MALGGQVGQQGGRKCYPLTQRWFAPGPAGSTFLGDFYKSKQQTNKKMPRLKAGATGTSSDTDGNTLLGPFSCPFLRPGRVSG